MGRVKTTCDVTMLRKKQSRNCWNSGNHLFGGMILSEISERNKIGPVDLQLELCERPLPKKELGNVKKEDPGISKKLRLPDGCLHLIRVRFWNLQMT